MIFTYQTAHTPLKSQGYQVERNEERKEIHSTKYYIYKYDERKKPHTQQQKQRQQQHQTANSTQ